MSLSQQRKDHLREKVFLQRNGLLEELKSELKRTQTQVVLPYIHWLSNGQSLLFKDYYIQSQQIDSTNKKDMLLLKTEDLFHAVSKKIPNRILVDGPPGCGKTTFAMKITNDWATDHPYLQQFDLLFFIPLWDLKGRTVEKVIDDLIIPHCLHERSVTLSELNHEKILLVLDGYDKIDRSSSKDVLSILHQQKLADMTVVVTSRNGFLHTEYSHLHDLNPDFPFVLKEFYQRRVTILGVNNRTQLLKNFYPNCEPEKIINAIKQIPDEKSLFRSPTLLIMIGYLNNWKLRLDVKLNLIELFKSLFTEVVKWNLARNGDVVCDEFNLFDISESQSQKCQLMLEEFGGICFYQLLDNKYVFEINEFILVIYGLGLLTQIGDLHMECFHLSVMEFCAAYYLWRKFVVSYDSRLVCARQFWNLSTSKHCYWLRPFLGHMLQDNGEVFFTLLNDMDKKSRLSLTPADQC